MPDTALLLAGCVLLAIAVLYLLVQNARLRSDIEGRAHTRYAQWRDRDWDRAVRDARAVAEAESRAQIADWKGREESRIRRDALEKSRASSMGKTSEQLAPFFQEFPFDPRDARFLGSPVDFLVFDGLSRGALAHIVFTEVKTGPFAKLSGRERQVRDAVEAGRVRWMEVRLADTASEPTEASYFLPLSDGEGEMAGQIELLPITATLRHWPGVSEAPRTYTIDVAHIVRRAGATFLRLDRNGSAGDRFRLLLGDQAHLEVHRASHTLLVLDADLDVREYTLGIDAPLDFINSDELLLRLQGGR
jgi:predicted Holliday junction resolvase-like endonuclease